MWSLKETLRESSLEFLIISASSFLLKSNSETWNDNLPDSQETFVHMKGRSHTFENAGFEIEFANPRFKNFGLDMCLTLRSLVSRLVPPFLVRTVCFQLRSEIEVLSLAKLDRSWRRTLISNKRGTSLETKILEVRHLRRPWFFYLGSPNSVLETNVLDRVVASWKLKLSAKLKVLTINLISWIQTSCRQCSW